jgi:hypothetical protein
VGPPAVRRSDHACAYFAARSGNVPSPGARADAASVCAHPSRATRQGDGCVRRRRRCLLNCCLGELRLHRRAIGQKTPNDQPHAASADPESDSHSADSVDHAHGAVQRVLDDPDRYMWQALMSPTGELMTWWSGDCNRTWWRCRAVYVLRDLEGNGAAFPLPRSASYSMLDATVDGFAVERDVLRHHALHANGGFVVRPDGTRVEWTASHRTIRPSHDLVVLSRWAEHPRALDVTAATVGQLPTLPTHGHLTIASDGTLWLVGNHHHKWRVAWSRDGGETWGGAPTDGFLGDWGQRQRRRRRRGPRSRAIHPVPWDVRPPSGTAAVRHHRQRRLMVETPASAVRFEPKLRCQPRRAPARSRCHRPTLAERLDLVIVSSHSRCSAVRVPQGARRGRRIRVHRRTRPTGQGVRIR